MADPFANIPWEPIGNDWEPVDNSPEAQGQAQMADLMKPQSTGFSGVQSNQELRQQLASDLNKEDPRSPEFYGGGVEGARQAGEFSGTAKAGPTQLGILGSAMVPAKRLAATGVGAGVGAYEGFKGEDPLFGALKGAAKGGTVGFLSPEIAKLAGYVGEPLIKAFLSGRSGTIKGRLLSEAIKAMKAEAGAATAAAEGGAIKTATKAATTAANPLEDTIQALMRGESSMGKMNRDVAERLALAIEREAGRGVPNIPREVANATTAARVGKAVSPLSGPRVQRGAERVGKTVGMTKEQVRQQAGPVLGEDLGTASPLLPMDVHGDILNALKKLPPGPQREAFVAAAKDLKTKWQVESFRRTLEHLGLLVPVAAGAAGSQMGGGDGW